MRPRVTASADLLLSKQFNVVREIHRETVQSSFGPMQMIHVRLVFGDTVKRWCEELARERLLYRRLAVAGVLLGMVLCAMSVAWGYLKLGPTAGFARSASPIISITTTASGLPVRDSTKAREP